MDLNGDGILDIISGGYPGELYLFAGQDDGTFAAREEIRNRKGEIINVGNASVPFASDWDRDGDLDLLVGNIYGDIVFIPNQSSGKQLMFGRSVEIGVGREAYRVDSGDTAPHVADWDGDGNHDLILGTVDGSVLFFQNTTNQGMPLLAPPVELVPKTVWMGPEQPDHDPVKDLGHHSRAWVADWNDDGRQDLLMGVWLPRNTPDRELTPDMEREKEKIEERKQDISERRSEISLRIRHEVLIDLGLDRRTRIYKRLQEKWLKGVREAKQQDIEYQELGLEQRRLNALLLEFRTDRFFHGWVWVFLRK